MKILAVIAFALALAGCELPMKPKPYIDPGMTADLEKARLESYTQETKYRITQEQAVVQLRLSVVSECTKQHLIPVLINGNVDCKPYPK